MGDAFIRWGRGPHRAPRLVVLDDRVRAELVDAGPHGPHLGARACSCATTRAALRASSGRLDARTDPGVDQLMGTVGTLLIYGARSFVPASPLRWGPGGDRGDAPTFAFASAPTPQSCRNLRGRRAVRTGGRPADGRPGEQWCSPGRRAGDFSPLGLEPARWHPRFQPSRCVLTSQGRGPNSA
jgi:hypothetical protein